MISFTGKQVHVELLSRPFLHLIQANVVWSANTGFLLPPLPVNELLIHQTVNQTLNSIQKLIHIHQYALGNGNGKRKKGCEKPSIQWLSYDLRWEAEYLSTLVEFIDKHLKSFKLLPFQGLVCCGCFSFHSEFPWKTEQNIKTACRCDSEHCQQTWKTLRNL